VSAGKQECQEQQGGTICCVSACNFDPLSRGIGVQN
jgi:hypothetical protein